MAVALTGFLSHVELFYIMIASAIVFMAMMVGIAYYQTSSFERTAKSKLKFSSLQFAITTDVPKSAKGIPTAKGKPFVNGAKTSLNLVNSAKFPVYLKDIKVATLLDGKVATDEKGKAIESKPISMVIDSMGVGWINDVVVPIEIAKALKGNTLLQGDFKYSLIYGKSEKSCVYELKGEFDIRIFLNNPPQLPIMEWNNKLPS